MSMSETIYHSLIPVVNLAAALALLWFGFIKIALILDAWEPIAEEIYQASKGVPPAIRAHRARTVPVSELSDSELDSCIDEALEREIITDDYFCPEYALRAHESLMAGRANEALCYLERAIYPSAAAQPTSDRLRQLKEAA